LRTEVLKKQKTGKEFFLITQVDFKTENWHWILKRKEIVRGKTERLIQTHLRERKTYRKSETVSSYCLFDSQFVQPVQSTLFSFEYQLSLLVDSHCLFLLDLVCLGALFLLHCLLLSFLPIFSIGYSCISHWDLSLVVTCCYCCCYCCCLVLLLLLLTSLLLPLHSTPRYTFRIPTLV